MCSGMVGAMATPGLAASDAPPLPTAGVAAGCWCSLSRAAAASVAASWTSVTTRPSSRCKCGITGIGEIANHVAHGLDPRQPPMRDLARIVRRQRVVRETDERENLVGAGDLYGLAARALDHDVIDKIDDI